MPQIKFDILSIGNVRFYADRSVDIEAVDRVRGEVVIRMQEDTARWFWASMADKVSAWRREDGEIDADGE